MSIKKFGVLVLSLLLAMGVFTSCSELEDAEALQELIDYFSDIESPADQNLEETPYYFPDPFYAYRTYEGNQGETDADGDEWEGYIIEDVVGLDNAAKYKPIKIYLSEYIDFKTFKEDNFTVTDAAGAQVPGLYFITFQWKQMPDIPTKFGSMDDLLDAVDGGSDLAGADVPDKSMIVVIPFVKVTGKLTVNFNGENIKNYHDKPLYAPPVIPTASEIETAASTAGADPATKPGAVTQDTTASTNTSITSQTAETRTEPAVRAETTAITFEDADTAGEFTYSGNAGRVAYAELFPGTTPAIHFSTDTETGVTLGSYAALLTSGDVYISGTLGFCKDASADKVDSTKKAISGKESSVTFNIDVTGKTKLKFDYYFVSAEIENWCKTGVAYDDELNVAVSPRGTSGNPTIATIQSQSEYADEVEADKTIITYLSTDSTGTQLPAGFDNYTNDGKFGVASEVVTSPHAVHTAEVDVTDMTAITVTITVTDMGDGWNTTFATIDNIRAE